MIKKVRSFTAAAVSAMMVLMSATTSFAVFYDAQTDSPEGKLLFPGDSIHTEGAVLVGPDRTYADLTEGIWTNTDPGRAYRVTGYHNEETGESGLLVNPEGYVVSVRGGVSFSDDGLGDTHSAAAPADTYGDYNAFDGEDDPQAEDEMALPLDVASYPEGTWVCIRATLTDSGRAFGHWEFEPQIYLEDIASPEISFLMPGYALSVKAVYAGNQAEEGEAQEEAGQPEGSAQDEGAGASSEWENYEGAGAASEGEMEAGAQVPYEWSEQADAQAGPDGEAAPFEIVYEDSFEDGDLDTVDETEEIYDFDLETESEETEDPEEYYETEEQELWEEYVIPEGTWNDVPDPAAEGIASENEGEMGDLTDSELSWDAQEDWEIDAEEQAAAWEEGREAAAAEIAAAQEEMQEQAAPQEELQNPEAAEGMAAPQEELQNPEAAEEMAAPQEEEMQEPAAAAEMAAPQEEEMQEPEAAAEMAAQQEEPQEPAAEGVPSAAEEEQQAEAASGEAAQTPVQEEAAGENADTPVEEEIQEDIQEEVQDTLHKVYLSSDRIFFNGEAASPDEASVAEGETVSLGAAEDEKESFSGWSVTQTGTGEPVSYEQLDDTGRHISFEMPSSDVTVEALYSARTASAVEVVNGLGGGEFAEGSEVQIEASPAPDGQQFIQWIVEKGNASLKDPAAPKTSFSMGDAPVSVRAMYDWIPYELTVISGKGGGTRHKGDTVNVTADWPADGKEFARWISDQASVEPADRFNASLVMPAANVSVTATYQDGPSPQANRIDGLSEGAEYLKETKLTFTAVGNGPDKQNPNPGDFKWVPSSYSIGNVTGGWSSSDYTTSMAISATGTYTLSVVFSKQIFDGNIWNVTDQTDQKSVSFHVVDMLAVQTGDQTPVTALVFTALAALAAVFMMLALRSRRRN